jgi:superfamily II DNA or RNA helicase
VSLANYTLRPYQREASESLMRAAYTAEYEYEETLKKLNKENVSKDSIWDAHRACAIQPTGAGKTLLMLDFAKQVKEQLGWRTHVVVPTIQLEQQTYDRALEVFQPEKVGRIASGICDFKDKDIVVSIAASLNIKRLKLIPPDQFELFIMDEAHHAAASSYESILEYFAPGTRLMLGLTATPIRGDGVNITSEEYFRKVIVWNSLSQLIDLGYLVKVKGVVVTTNTSLDNIEICGSDYNKSQLASVVNTESRNQIAYQAWEKYASGLPTVVFCAGIEHAQAVASLFNKNGVSAAPVWGDMRKKDYDQIMKDFQNGNITVLTNAKLLTEGWDQPKVCVAMLLKPMTPISACVDVPQMCGRALRPAPNKEEAIIIEVRDLGGKYSLNSSNNHLIKCDKTHKNTALAPSLLSMAFGLTESDLSAGEVDIVEISRENLKAELWKGRQEILDQLCKGELIEEYFDVVDRISKVSTFSWVPLGNSWYMSLGEGNFVEIIEENPCLHHVQAYIDNRNQSIGYSSQQSRAMRLAEKWVLDLKNCNSYLLMRNQPWRALPISSAQRGKLKSLTLMPEAELSMLTRGQASDLITTLLALIATSRNQQTDAITARTPSLSLPSNTTLSFLANRVY